MRPEGWFKISPMVLVSSVVTFGVLAPGLLRVDANDGVAPTVPVEAGTLPVSSGAAGAHSGTPGAREREFVERLLDPRISRRLQAQLPELSSRAGAPAALVRQPVTISSCGSACLQTGPAPAPSRARRGR